MRLERADTTGVVQDGRLTITRRALFRTAIRALRDGPVIITVRRQRKGRSLQSNAFYWSVVVQAIAEHTGYTPDETHHALKMLFLPKHVALADGNGEVIEELVIGGSTATLSQGDFSDYVSRVKEWAREKLDLHIPEPNEPYE